MSRLGFLRRVSPTPLVKNRHSPPPHSFSPLLSSLRLPGKPSSSSKRRSSGHTYFVMSFAGFSPAANPLRLTSFSKPPFLNKQDAAALDEMLMGPEIGYTLPQLMELAGQAVGFALAQQWSREDLLHQQTPPADEHQVPRILVFCGPGNNGGDGLVAARHLRLLGYQADIVYPQEPKTEYFKALILQCEQFGCKVFRNLDDLRLEQVAEEYCVIIDAVFGFSFDANREIRGPYDKMIQLMTEASRLNYTNGEVRQQVHSGDPRRAFLLSIDIPSGWDVDRGATRHARLSEEGKVEDDTPILELLPDLLVSLSAPKLCSLTLPSGNLCAHVLGGRFLPPAVIEKFSLESLPEYQDLDLVVSLQNHPVTEDC